MNTELDLLDPATAIAKGNEVAKTKLTNWAKEPTLEQLKHDYKSSMSFQEKHINRVRDWVDAFAAEGFYKPPKITGRSSISPKLIRKQVEWRCPSLTEPFLSNKQLLEVAARTGEDVAASKQNQLILNYQFQNKINLVQLMDEIVRTMAIEGTAIIKPRWNFEESNVTVFNDVWEPEFDPTVAQEYQAMTEQLQADPNYKVMLTEGDKLGLAHFMETGEPYRYVNTEREEIEESRVVANHPEAEICEIEDVYFDPTCKGKISKAKFVVHRTLTCLADLEADGRYKNLKELKNHVKSNSEEVSHNVNDTGFQFRDSARKQIEAYEYWGYWDTDGTGTLNPIVATWVGNILIQLERSPLTGTRYPFIFIPLIPIKGSVYGEPDAELLSDNQMIVGATMRGLIDIFGRSANGQVGTAKGFLDAANKSKFNNGNNYEYNNELPPDRAIHTHKFPELPQSAFQMIQLMNNEAESLSGTQAFNQGIQGNSLGKVASGVRAAMSASAKRDAAILRRIAQGITSLAYAFQEMNAMFLTEDDYIRLTNNQFVPVDPYNLNGDFDLKIDISTAEEDAAKVEDLAMLMQTGQGAFPFEFTKKILAKIANLKKLPDLEQFIENYEPQPDPIAERKAQLEIERMELDNRRIEAETAEIMYKAQVNAAEVAVRKQRADKLQSDKDNSDLKFYKDAEGVNHQEALDKINTQAEAQRRNKDADHLNKVDELRLGHNSNLLTERARADLSTVDNPKQPQ